MHYNNSLLDEMAAKAMTSKSYQNKSDALDDIQSMIEKVIDSYNAISVLMDEIDAKHSSMTKQSIDKIRYVMSADQTVKGKLVDLMKAYAMSDEKQESKINTILQEGITVNRQEYIDSGSFFHKNIKSRRSNEPPQPIAETRDIEKEVLGAVVEKLRSGYSDARVKSYMDSMFVNGKSEISSEEIAVKNDEDYILTLLTVVNAYRGRRGYQIQIDSGFVKKDGYRIPRFILKKGGKR